MFKIWFLCIEICAKQNIMVQDNKLIMYIVRGKMNTLKMI